MASSNFKKTFIFQARSSVFRSLFEEDPDRTRSTVENVSADGFEQLIHYIYTSNIPKLDQHFMALMKAAHQFPVSGLMDICEAKAMQHLSTDNAAEIFQLAHSCDCSDMLKKTSYGILQK